MADENPYLAVIRIWAAMAWADGQVVDRERAALERLIAGAELNDGERQVARSYLDARVDLDERHLAGMGKYVREGVYRAACKLSAIDQDVSDSERKLLGRLRSVLELDRESADDIERSVGL
jgi:uncharacterized membrane protein YebE (DUF533 family)